VLICADRAEAHWLKAKAGARERAGAIYLLGSGHNLAEDYPAAIAAYREAVAIWRSLDRESMDIAIGLNALADAERSSGDFDAAERDFREALRIARAVAYHEGIAYITNNQAALALHREDWPGAEALAREALPLIEDLGRLELIGSTCHHLANALVRQGNKDEALPHARRAVEICQKLGSPELTKAQQTLAECER